MTGETLRVLHIEDNPADADLLEEILASEGHRKGYTRRLQAVWAPKLEHGLAYLAKETFHAVLLDLSLPDSEGLPTIERVRQVAPETAILVMTGLDDDELALNAMQAGAQDYLIKGQLNEALLERAIRYAIERKRIEVAQKRRTDEIEALYQTSLEINAEFEITTLLNAIVERAARLINVPIGGLYLLDPDGQNLILTVGYNILPQYIGAVLRRGEGLSGIVAENGEPLAISDYLVWPQRSPTFTDGTFRRVLGIPLRVQGRVIGVINVADDRKPGPFSKEEIRLVSMLADQAAIAVEKARLLEAERQKGLELARSNRLIAALNQVAGRLQTTMEARQVMETVGAELLQLGVSIEIAQTEAGQDGATIQYSVIDKASLDSAEALLGYSIPGLRTGGGIAPALSAGDARTPKFITNMVQFYERILPQADQDALENALAVIGISQRTAGIHLPLIVKDQPIGALLVWGDDIYDNDLPAFTVFANQVSAALENARLYNEIQKLAIMDELTGLYNRRGFFALAQQQVHLAQRANTGLLLIFADIDGMKTINDTLGHRQGDQALIDAARVLKQTYRSADIIARMGGDEFAVLAMMSEKPATGPLVKRLSEQVAEFNAAHQRPYELSLSMGMAAWPAGKLANLDDLLSRADARMYIEKRNKKVPD